VPLVEAMTPKLRAIDERRSLLEKSEELCLTLLRTDIDLAHSFLRLADTELKLGAAPRAAELIEKAITAHDHVIRRLERPAFGFEQEQRALERDARELFQAIAAAFERLGMPPRSPERRRPIA